MVLRSEGKNWKLQDVLVGNQVDERKLEKGEAYFYLSFFPSEEVQVRPELSLRTLNEYGYSRLQPLDEALSPETLRDLTGLLLSLLLARQDHGHVRVPDDDQAMTEPKHILEELGQVLSNGGVLGLLTSAVPISQN